MTDSASSRNVAQPPPDAGSASGGAAGTRSVPSKAPPRLLPPWKVLLHNDDVNQMQHVVETICMLTPLSQQDALLRMKEAHETGVALLLTTHQERAELYVQQFASRNVTVTVEPTA